MQREELEEFINQQVEARLDAAVQAALNARNIPPAGQAPAAGAGAGGPAAGADRPVFLRGLGEAPTLTSTDEKAFRTWRQKYQSIAPHLGWTLAQQKLLAIERMSEDARAVVEDLDVQADNNDFTLAQALDLFAERFLAGVGTEKAIARFHNSQQLPDETSRAWASRAQRLYSEAYPNVNNVQENGDLLRRIRNKLFDKNTITAMVGHQAQNVNQLVQLIHRIEADREQYQQLAQGGGGLNAINHYLQGLPQDQRQQAMVAALQSQSTDGFQPGDLPSPSGPANEASNWIHSLQALGNALGPNRPSACYICDRVGHRMVECAHRNNLSMVKAALDKLAQKVAQLARNNRNNSAARRGSSGGHRGRGGGSARGKGQPRKSSGSSNRGSGVRAMGYEDGDEAGDDNGDQYGDEKSDDSGDPASF